MRKRKSFKTPWISALETKSGVLKNWRHHDAWPSWAEVMEAKKNGDKLALRCLDHHGWYTDNFHSGEVQYAAAIKVRIPRRLAKTYVCNENHLHSSGYTRVRWVEATAHTDWDAISISRECCHCTLDDAIRAADFVSQRLAEDARDEAIKFEAECRIDDLKEEIKSSREMVLECVFELRLMRKHYQSLLVSSEVLKDRIRSEWASIAKNRKQIQKLINEPWSIAA